MSTCPVVPLDLGSPYATLLDPKSPSEQTRRGVDWADWLACNNPGATITLSTWAVHADDDDGTLTLTADALDVSNIASVLVQAGTVDKSYRVVNTVTLSDAQVISATLQISVRDVWKQALAA